MNLSPLIHLIDDDAAVRESLALLIGTVGLRVQTWAEPQQFLAGFDRSAVGAIVLDVRMPGVSGMAVLEQLAAEGIDQPVIMLTGHGTIEMCRRAFKSGAAEFLEKPVDDQALPYQQGNRPCAGTLAAHRRNPPRASLRQARRRIAGATDPALRPACGTR